MSETIILLEEDFNNIADTVQYNEDWDVGGGEINTDAGDEGDLIFNSVDMTGLENGVLTFDARVSGWFEGSGHYKDTLVIDLLDANGQVIQTLDVLIGDGSQLTSSTGTGATITTYESTITYALPEGLTVFSLRFNSDFTASSEDLYIDHLKITGEQAATGSISGFVFIDGDGDATELTSDPSDADGVEAGFAGAEVQLLNAEGEVVQTVFADENGAYTFENVAEGQYRVKFILPNGYEFVPQDIGGYTIDSDADPNSGETILISVGPDQHITNVDAGIASPLNAADDAITVTESEGAGDVEVLDSGATSILANDDGADGGAYQGQVVEVNGVEGLVGTWIELPKGRVMINADGTVDFDANGDFEALDDGESEEITLTYTIRSATAAAPDGQLSYQFYNHVPSGYTIENIPTDGADFEGAVDNFDVNALAWSLTGDGDTYAIRYTGFIAIDEAGRYDFSIGGDDGVGIWIDGQLVAARDGLHPVEWASGGLDLSAGVHSVEIRFFENYGGQGLYVEVSGPDTNGDVASIFDMASATDPTTDVIEDSATVTIRVEGETDVPLEAVDDFVIVTESEAAGDQEEILDAFDDATAAATVTANDVAEGGGQYAGQVVEVNGVSGQVGQFIDLAAGGRVKINADGTLDFDADGDFEDLDDGQFQDVTVDYAIQGPDGSGPAPKHNILFVIDISGSTSDAFGGSPVGDQNGDGSSNTVLDAEIAAYKALIAQIQGSGLSDSDVDIGLIAFSGTGSSNPVSELLGTFNPSDPALIAALEGLQDGGFTNFEAPLQTGLQWFSDQGATTSDENIVYFLSDGEANQGGSFADESAALVSDFGAVVNAVGVGTDVDKDQLDIVDSDGDAQVVTTTDALTAALVENGPVVPGEIDRATVTIRVEGETDVPLEAVDDFVIVTESEAAGDQEEILDAFDDATAAATVTANDVAEGGGQYAGQVVEVNGVSGQVGQFIDLAAGGRVKINADGTLDFDADGDFEDLDDGQFQDVTVDYAIQGPDGSGPAPKHNILFVIDISGSTSDAFGGSPVGDQNGDGSSNTVLDAEIAAYKALIAQIQGSGLSDSDVDIGLIAFSGTGSSNPVSELLGTFNPSDPALIAALEGLQDGGFTNFEAPLQTGLQWFSDQGATTSDENIVYFLSDGEANQGGSFADESAALVSDFGAVVNAVGVGTDVDKDQLDIVDSDGDAQVVTTTDALTAALVENGPVVPGEIDRATVTIRVEGETDVPLEAVDDFVIVTESEAAGDQEEILDAFDDATAAATVTANDVAEGGGQYAGQVVEVNGVSGQVGQFIDLAVGGRVKINADGTLDFDADGDFEDLNDGQFQDVTVDYAIQGPDGSGPAPKHNILFVIDISLSVEAGFGGAPVGDVNGDGLSNTVLDAEIAAYQALIAQIQASGLTDDDVDIGVVVFSGAQNASDQTGASRLIGTFKPSDPALSDALEALRTDQVPLGATNFEAPLQAGVAWYEAQGATTADENIVYFLSDGEVNRGGAFDDEAADLAARFGADLNAVGVGTGAVLDELNVIDNTGGAEIVTTTEDLTAALVENGPVVPGEIDSATVTIRVEGETDVPLEAVDDFVIVTESEAAGDQEEILDAFDDATAAATVTANDVAEGGGQYAGQVVEVNGVSGQVGQFIDLAAGGRVKINADGTLDFDADGDFEDLDDGQFQDVTVDYAIQGPDGSGPAPKHNILFVIDISLSVEAGFGGAPVGDVNGDGLSNTVLDAEIAAYQALIAQIQASGLTDDDVDIGVVVFSGAQDANDQAGASRLIGTFKPSDPALSDALEALRTDQVPLGATNFEAPLQAGVAWYEAQGATTSDENIVYFLSDGEVNRGGAFDDEAADLATRFGADLNAVGVGTGAVLDELNVIDNTGGAEIVTTTEDLTAALVENGPVVPGEIDRATVTIRVEGETDVPLEAVDDFVIVTESEAAGDQEEILDAFDDATAAATVTANDVAEGGGQYAGQVVEVNGVSGQVGQFIDLAAGGRVKINADGTLDFDADGDFEDLDDGQFQDVTVEYSIQGPDGSGPAPKHNILFVIDISGSTSDAFGGSPVGDQNGDGSSNTVLDAEIAAYKALIAQIQGSGLSDSDVDIGLIAFSGTGSSNPVSELLGTFNPSDPALIAALEGLQDGGFTNFEAPLQTGLQWFSDQGATTSDENIVYFLSDGEANQGGSFADESAALVSDFGAVVNAVGVGTDVDKDQLDIVDSDGDAQVVTTTDALTAALVENGPVVPGEIDRATVTIRVEGETDVPLEAVDDFVIVTESEAAGDQEEILDAFDDATAAATVTANDVAEGGGQYAGQVVEVNGVSGQVGQFIDLAAGGRVKINADGTLDFDADGDFEDLDDGQFQDVTVEYSIQGPDGSGPAPKHNILFVIDISLSVEAGFGGAPVGDVNGDGLSNTVLDAEIAAYQALIAQIQASGLTDDDVDIGVVVFSGAQNASDQTGASRLIGTFKPSDPALSDALEALRTDQVPLGATNFEAPLQAGVAWYEAQGATTSDENIVYFLSDGEVNRGGAFDDEAADLAARFGADLNAVGVGTGAVLDELNVIDNTGGAEIVTTTEDLTAALVENGPVVPGEIDSATVTIRVEGETDVPLEAVDDFVIVTESEAAGDQEEILDAFDDVTAAATVTANDIAEGGGAYQGLVVRVNGVAGQVGQFIDLAGGGRVQINAGGTLDFDADGDFEDLNDGEFRDVTVEYSIESPTGVIDSATVNIRVQGETDIPIDALNDFVIVTESEAAGDQEEILDAFDDTTAAATVTANDSAEGGGAYQGDVVEVNGVVGDVGQFIDLAEGGRVKINADGTLDFDADGDFDALGDGQFQDVSVDYTISAISGSGATDSATVAIRVLGEDPNAPPVALDDFDEILFASDLFPGDVQQAGVNALDNDSDPDFDPVSIVRLGVDETEDPDGWFDWQEATFTDNFSGTPIAGDDLGQIRLNVDGTFEFRAGDNFFFGDISPAGDPVDASLDYEITDPGGLTSTANLTFTLSGEIFDD